MRLCRVIGTVVASAQHPAFDGHKLMLVRPEDRYGNKAGRSSGTSAGAGFVAVDTVQAGPGDLVLVLSEGNGSRQILKADAPSPIRSLIVGIVDDVAT